MHFVAIYPLVKQATEFAANAVRVVNATNVTRKGKVVEFDVALTPGEETDAYGDVRLSVGYYGGDGTTLNGNRLPRGY